MFLEAYQELTAGNLVLLALVTIAFIFIFFVVLKRLIGFAFWAILLFIVLVAGFAIYDEKLADAVKQLVTPSESNTSALDKRFMIVVDLLKQDSEEVLAKWQFLWKPTPLTKEKPAEQPAEKPEAKKAEAPAPAEPKS